MILVIFGAGGNGKYGIEFIMEENKTTRQWEQIVFVDDVVDESEMVGFSVYSFADFQKHYAPEDEVEFLISVGDPDSREKVYQMISAAGYRFATYISRDSYISPSCKIGEGCAIISSRIGALSTIGKNTLMMGFAHVGHDCTIGSHCILGIYAVIGGHSVLGSNLFVGAHSAVRDGITVGDHSVISLASAVLKDIPSNSVVIGNPARVLPRRNGVSLFK